MSGVRIKKRVGDRYSETRSDSNESGRRLGTVDAAEQLLRELYVDLRRSIRAWSEVTAQTPQARMGYVGQHLTSVVTGFQGSRSGARGQDLRLPDKRHGEIKTCYRVDQLGSCVRCGAGVSSFEEDCPACGSKEVVRKDDSKWLVGIRNQQEMRELFDPAYFYLVLFDFTADDEEMAAEAASDDGTADVVTVGAPDINARIWRVDPRLPGFGLCMVDYYLNIQAKSKSKAPFNLWPYSLKFQLMRAELIYHAVIKADDTISTKVFEGQVGNVEVFPVAPFPSMVGSRVNLPDEKLLRFARNNRVDLQIGMRRMLLDGLEKARRSNGWPDEWLADELAWLMYGDKLKEGVGYLPEALRDDGRLG